MPVTDTDVAILQLLSAYYVLTREQVQRLLFAEHTSGRGTRKRLSKLQRAGYLRKHRVQVTLPGWNGAAPVYYLTKAGAELLASYFDVQTYLAANTRSPRADRLNHWIAINETRLLLERSCAALPDVELTRWINEWETVNQDAAATERFTLHVQFSEDPPLSCSPDAAFLLSVRGHRKVFYLEQDLGTSSPNQIAARKTKGYAALAAQGCHRQQFPQATVDRFSVLLITTTRYRRDAAIKAIGKRPAPDLWLAADEHELTVESLLTAPVFLDHQGRLGPLVKPHAGSEP